MLIFRKTNLNPKNRRTGDCSTRAIANLLGISWEEALKLQYEKSLETKYDMSSREVTERVLADFGYVKSKQPRKLNGLKYKIRELDSIIHHESLEKGIIVNCANHYTVVRGSYIEDTWDCGGKTAGNFFVKGAPKL